METAHHLLLNLENHCISLFQLLLLKDRHIWAVPALQPHFAGTKPPPWLCQLWAMERRSLGSTTTASATGFKHCVMAKLLLYSFRIITFSCSKSRLSSKVRSFHSAGAQCISAVFHRQTGDLHASWTPASPELETLYWHIRPCTALETRMLSSASHSSVIQEWSSFFLFIFINYFLFFSSSSFPLFPLSPPLWSFFFFQISLLSPFFQVTKPFYALIFL